MAYQHSILPLKFLCVYYFIIKPAQIWLSLKRLVHPLWVWNYSRTIFQPGPCPPYYDVCGFELWKFPAI